MCVQGLQSSHSCRLRRYHKRCTWTLKAARECSYINNLLAQAQHVHFAHLTYTTATPTDMSPRANVCAEQTSICFELKPPEACSEGPTSWKLTFSCTTRYHAGEMPNNAFEIVWSIMVLVIQVYMSALILGTLLNYLVRTDTILFTCVLRVSAVSLCLLLIVPHLSNVGLSQNPLIRTSLIGQIQPS